MSALRKPDPAGKVIPLRPEPALASAYRQSVSIHYPNTDPLTMSIRVEIMGLRDRACLGLRRCGPEAEVILAEAARIATLAALSTSTTKQLAFVQIAIDSLIFAADMMRRSKL